MHGLPSWYRDALEQFFIERWLEFGAGLALCASIAYGVTALVAFLERRQAARQQAEYLRLERENYLGRDKATLLRAARQPVCASELLHPLCSAVSGADEYLLRAAATTTRSEVNVLRQEIQG